MKLTRDFYLRNDVIQISKELLGKYLFTKMNGRTTAGIISETEAYAGVIDRASHAYGGKRTKRTKIMYKRGGAAYVYLCYGMHHLFNIVTNEKDIPHAILIRAIKPVEGVEIILKRRKLSAKVLLQQEARFHKIANGPGTVSQALGIYTKHSGTDLLGNKIWLEDNGIKVKKIIIEKRIGVDYAGEDAKLPYRFVANL